MSFLDYIFKNKKDAGRQPTIFHITHQKAGSQWVKAVLKSLDESRIVEQKVREVQFFEDPIVKGNIYPGIYVDKNRFDTVVIPDNSIKFIIIRDLRDMLVSFYFSMRYSHPVLDEFITKTRNMLNSSEKDEGMIHLIENHFLEPVSKIQRSWIDTDDLLIKYEDLFTQPEKKFLEIFSYCRIEKSRGKLLKAITENSFEKKSGGRKSGEEDVKSHLRKGSPGDWENHFSDKLKDVFKARYGNLLVETGYENDLNW